MSRDHRNTPPPAGQEEKSVPRVELLVAVCQQKCTENGPAARLTKTIEALLKKQEAREAQQDVRNAALHEKVNTTANRLWYIIGGVAAIVALLGLLHLRIGITSDGSVPKHAQVDKSSEKADNSHLIGNAQAAPNDWVVTKPTKGEP